MKTIIILALTISISLAVTAQTIVPSGNVNGNWTLAGSPYLIQGHIIVPDGTTLTIEPGVDIEFQGYYKLFCNGRILALGTVTDSITFTVPAANISSGWLGIRFDNTPSTNDSSRFNYCTIKYGQANFTVNEGHGGAFYFNNFSKCIISHCYLAKNNAVYGGGAIYCYSSSPLIMNNILINNYSYNGGHGIECTYSSSVITNNTITNGGDITLYNSSLTIISNKISGSINGGISSYNSSSIISNNIITSNTALSLGGGILLYNSYAAITNNIISYNVSNFAGGGIACFNDIPNSLANSVITSNLITNNFAGNQYGGDGNGGGGIYCSNASPYVFNNTICNNSSNLEGGGLYCAKSSNPIVKNSIFYNNTAKYGNGNNIALADNSNDPSFSYCDIQGGLTSVYTNGNPYTGSYENNINAEPKFVDPSSTNYYLQATSECLNAGTLSMAGLNPPTTDLLGNPRIVGIIDLGAYEYQVNTNITSNSIQNNMVICPNPFVNFTIIKLKAAVNFSDLNIYNLFGQKVRTINDISGDQIKIERNGLNSGIYFFELKQEGKVVATEKLIIAD